MYANADERETHIFCGASYLIRIITIRGHVSIKHSSYGMQHLTALLKSVQHQHER